MSQIDDLPPLRDVVRTHGLLAKKSLGQNFLFDLNLTSRIARAAGPLQASIVIEVGPGPGGLTRALLAEGARKVIAIERDPRCLPALEEIAGHYPQRLEVISGDALDFDPKPLLQGASAKIVSNLPYNVGTALLMHWLATTDWPPWWESLTLMFQREVAERIVADERDAKAYGRLGVICGWRTNAKILFDVQPSAFVPPPKITSSVVHLTPKLQPAPCRLNSLEAVTRAAFGQRRKMLRQSLKYLSPQTGELIRAAALDETMRAEEVPISGFVTLANVWDAFRAAER